MKAPHGAAVDAKRPSFPLPDGEVCGMLASDVHHRVPIESGGARRDPANLIATCRPHHSSTHRNMI